jgi:hypothetical protein
MKNLLIDGLSGSGKWVVSRMCCCIKGSQNISLDEGLEILINSNFVSKNNNFVQQVESYLNYTNFYKYIGRNINMRKKDLTYSGQFPFESPERVYTRNENDYDFHSNSNGISILMTHGGSLCGLADYMEFFKNSIYLIKIKKNPLELISKWTNYVHRYGNDFKEFTFCYKYKNILVPWFVYGFEDDFLNAKTNLEKVIVIFTAYEFFNKKASNLLKKSKNYLEIDLNNFLKNPELNLNNISKLLGQKFQNNDIYKKLCIELELPRKVTIEKGYWTQSKQLNLNEEIKKIDSYYLKKLNYLIEERNLSI